MELIAGYDRSLRINSRASDTGTRTTSQLLMFAEWMAPRSVADAGEVDVAAFITSRQLSQRSRQAYRGRLYRFYRWAVDRDLVATNPTTGVEVPRATRKADGRATPQRRRNVELPVLSRDLIRDYDLSLRRRALATGSRAKMRATVVLLAERVAPRTLAEVTTEDIETFIDARHVSARTRYAYVSLTHSFFKWAVIHDQIVKDPTLAIERPATRAVCRAARRR